VGQLCLLEGREFYGEYTGLTDPLGAPRTHPVSHVAYSYAAHLAELDEAGRLKRVIAAYDSGRIINPLLAEGQVEGGVLMSLGYALCEDMRMSGGAPQASFARLGLLKAGDAPEIVTLFVGKEDAALYDSLPAAGAKGLGEIAAIATAAALQAAYFKRDGLFRTKLPLSALNDES
jgi:CO/xanthine dehydrogenase Mo-binding subunit